MSKHAVFLRGVNVGGAGVVPMAACVASALACGAHTASSYLQSGNLVVDVDDVERFRTAFEVALWERDQLRTVVMMRTATSLARLLALPVFGDAPTTARHFAFWSCEPDLQRVQDLSTDRSPGDVLVVDGEDGLLLYPNGVGRSKLTLDWMERQLGVKGTVRGWRTVAAMVERA